MALKELKKGSVSFLMPCGSPVEPRVVQRAMCLVSHAWSKGHDIIQVGITDRTLVHTARNVLAKEFLQTESEWAFWMDSDMILEPRTIDVMLTWADKLKAKMLTGIYYQRMGDHKPLVLKHSVKSQDGTVLRSGGPDAYVMVFPEGVGGLPFKVDTAGFGCVLMHRSVLEAMTEPYFIFDFVKDDKGKTLEMSEDFYFFREAEKLGFDLWAVPELNCGHLGTAPVITHADMKAKLDMSNMVPAQMEVASK